MYALNIGFKTGKLFFLLQLFVCLLQLTAGFSNLNVGGVKEQQFAAFPSNGAAVDEVVVESSLYIKPKVKQSMRRAYRSMQPGSKLVTTLEN